MLESMGVAAGLGFCKVASIVAGIRMLSTRIRRSVDVDLRKDNAEAISSNGLSVSTVNKWPQNSRCDIIETKSKMHPAQYEEPR